MKNDRNQPNFTCVDKRKIDVVKGTEENKALKKKKKRGER